MRRSPLTAQSLECKPLLHLPLRSTVSSSFFTELVGETVEETNRYSSELQEKMAPGVLGKLAWWVPTTIKVMYLFLVAVLLMGVIRKPSLQHYWSTNLLLQTSFFGMLFSQDHFLLLLRCLHFTNSARAGHHAPLHKIRSIFTGVTSSFHRVFVPYKDLCVDESLMKWKGRLAFCQYIPTKRDQLGPTYVQDMGCVRNRILLV